MKKLLLLTLLTIMLTLTVGQLAFAETCEEQICKMAMKNEKVNEAKCIIYERCCVVAIKTEKFTSKKEYDQFVKELTEKIKTDCEVDHVFVTRNPKVMAEIKNLASKSQTERDEAIRRLLERETHKLKPDDKLIIPRRTDAEQQSH